MLLSLEGDLLIYYLACVCSVGIMGVVLLVLKYEVFEIIMNFIGIFLVDFLVLFNFFYMSVFIENLYILIIYCCYLLYYRFKR